MKTPILFALILQLLRPNLDPTEIRNALISRVWATTTSRGAYANDSKNVDRVSVAFYSNSTGVCAIGNNPSDFSNRLSNFNWRLTSTDDDETIITITPISRGTGISPNGSFSYVQLMFMKNSEYNVRLLNRNGNVSLRFAPEGSDKENETLYVYFQ